MESFRIVPTDQYTQFKTLTAALGGSLYYGEKRRMDKKAEAKQRDRDDRNRELERSIKIAQANIAER